MAKRILDIEGFQRDYGTDPDRGDRNVWKYNSEWVANARARASLRIASRQLTKALTPLLDAMIALATGFNSKGKN